MTVRPVASSIPSGALASADLQPYDVLYLGPTTDVADYAAAAGAIRELGGFGGGLVVEPNVLDPESWSWVPSADRIGHSGAANVGFDTVSIVAPSHPIVEGLTDQGLSHCDMSVHSNFTTPEAGGFVTLARDHLQFGSATIIAREAPAIFSDGFESGDVGAWSMSTP
jgi:hypothetical protein